jgi:dTDP-4-amino-4,6-dideoxygalactose transaminase
VDGVVVPPRCDSGTHAWHLYPIQVDPDVMSIDRDTFIRALRDEGVGTSVHFIPIHYHAYYSRALDYGRGSFPIAEEFFERAVSLPIYPSMSDADAGNVVAAVTKLAGYYKR